jgi:hexosaminidase
MQLNTFHWHIVDSQSFPLVVPNYTDIAQKGAYSSQSVYTPQDVAHIVSYAGAVRSGLFLPSSSSPHI